ncbi:MAG: hypothetical protein ACRDSL_04345 [Pseudonocardiaceae bacterium]
MTQEHPARTYQRALAMTRHAARKDHVAYCSLLSEVIGTQAMGAEMLAVVQVAGLLMSRVPDELREQLFDEAMLALAQTGW